jgi:hypothetical protein
MNAVLTEYVRSIVNEIKLSRRLLCCDSKLKECDLLEHTVHQTGVPSTELDVFLRE